MKQYWRQVKVGDLLHNPGKVDTMTFEWRYIDSNTTEDTLIVLEPGISGDVELTALNKFSVQVMLYNISCTIEDISDISGESFTRNVIIEEYETLFVMPEWEKDIDEIYDSYNDIYEINPKDFTIDLQDCIINAIRSQDPIVKKKDDESLSDWWNIDESDKYDY